MLASVTFTNNDVESVGRKPRLTLGAPHSRTVTATGYQQGRRLADMLQISFSFDMTLQKLNGMIAAKSMDVIVWRVCYDNLDQRDRLSAARAQGDVRPT
jgi:hypothetical protein